MLMSIGKEREEVCHLPILFQGKSGKEGVPGLKKCIPISAL